MSDQNATDRPIDPHPDDEHGKHPPDVKGKSRARRELRDNLAVNGYSHDDKGNRTGGDAAPDASELRASRGV